ncbi:MAG: hypothetical protein AAF420_04030 [Pseudomonadota bacterium]
MERVLFCPGNRIIAYDWSRGKFGGVRRFSANDDGYREFELYLQKPAFQTVHIVVDLIEEEFHPDTVPHAWGTDRAAVLDRAAKKYFRTSELRSLQVQGRQKGGRRDTEVLISGLGSATILRRWLEILQRVRVPVKGIYSLPLVGQNLLSAMKMDKRRVLLVSQQSPMTLRQSFYDGGKLKLSRLALHRMAREDSSTDVKYVASDVNNTLLYLRSQRLIRRNEPLEVCVIVRDELHESFELGLPGDDLITYSIYRQSDVAKKIGVRSELPTFHSDGIFAHTLLAKSKVENHYGPRDLTRFFRYHIARKAMLVVAVLALFSAGAYVASLYYEVQLLHRYTVETRILKKLYRKHYLERVGQAEAYQLAPDAVKSTVGSINLLRDYAQTTPLPILTEVAGIVTRNSNIQIKRINWLQHPQPTVEIGNNTLRPRSAIRSDLETDAGHFQVASIEGEISDFSDDYRFAMEKFENFVADLEATGSYRFVEIDKTPFNIDSATGVSGDSGTSARENLTTRSTFKLRVTVEMPESEEGEQ